MRDKLLSLQNLWRRLKGESPSFFRKMRSLMGALAGAGAAIALLAEKYPLLFPPDSFWVEASSHMLVGGVLAALVASFTVKDNSHVDTPQ